MTASPEKLALPRRTAHRLALAVLATGLTLLPGGAGAQAVPPSPPQPGIVGVWIDHTAQGAVEFHLCGDKLCGRVAWIKAPLDAKGRPMTDAENPDRAKRNVPMCGLQIVGNLVRQPDGSWGKGWIYNPDDGGTFDVEVRLKSADVLLVHGYAGFKFLGETFTWKRASAGLPRCTGAV